MSSYWVSQVGYGIARVDVLSPAGLYTLRLIAGAAAAAVIPSFWLLAFSMFMFLGLAIIKRYTELRSLLASGADQHRAERGGSLGVVNSVISQHVTDHDRDIVGAAGIEAGIDKIDARGVRSALAQDLSDLAGLKHATTPIGRKQQPVANLKVDEEGVRLGAPIAIESTQDQIAIGMDPCLLLGDPAVIDQALHERMVAGQLTQLPITQQIGPTVTDVRDRQLLADHQPDRDRRTGAVEGWVLLDQIGQLGVGFVEHAGQHQERIAVGLRLIEATHLRDRGRAGDVAARCTTHAVGHGQQVRPGIAGVLVVASYATNIGEGGEKELHLRSSKKVLPIRI